MKKLFYYVCMLGLLTTLSCKDDDVKIDGDIVYDGKGYTGQKGLVVDFGDDGLHSNYTVFLGNGNFVVDDLQGSQLDFTMLFFAELFSPGTDQFRTGTFTFNDGNDVEGDYYFYDAGLTIDSNNDGVLTASDQNYSATAGTIELSGTPHNYTLSFDLTLDSGKKLTGSYTGTFEYVDYSSTAELQGTFTLGDREYDIYTGILQDYGGVGLTEGAAASHYNYDFLFTDAIVSNTGGLAGLSYLLYTGLYSAGSEQFKPGTYPWINTETATLEELQEESFFVVVLFEDSNGDGDIEDDADQVFEPTGGTVTVSGAGTDLTLIYDLTFANGETLQFTYSGDFYYSDQTGGRRLPEKGLNFTKPRFFQVK